MQNEFKDLINELSSQLKPVKPMASFSQQFLTLMMLSTVITGSLVIYWQYQLQEQNLPMGRSLLQTLFVLFTALYCTYFSLRSLSPHTAQTKMTFFPILTSFLWASLSFLSFIFLFSKNPEGAMIAIHYQTWHCPVIVFSIAIPLSLSSSFLLSKGAFLFPRTTFLYWTLMTLSWSVLGLSFVCTWSDPMHEILWHVAPAVFLVLVLFYGGLTIWRTLTKRTL